jgi:hypothetical protein
LFDDEQTAHEWLRSLPWWILKNILNKNRNIKELYGMVAVGFGLNGSRLRDVCWPKSLHTAS